MFCVFNKIKKQHEDVREKYERNEKRKRQVKFLKIKTAKFEIHENYEL